MPIPSNANLCDGLTDVLVTLCRSVNTSDQKVICYIPIGYDTGVLSIHSFSSRMED